jgi:hypothetical protein
MATGIIKAHTVMKRRNKELKSRFRSPNMD